MVGERAPYKVGREITMETGKREPSKPHSLQVPGAWRKEDPGNRVPWYLHPQTNKLPKHLPIATLTTPLKKKTYLKHWKANAKKKQTEGQAICKRAKGKTYNRPVIECGGRISSSQLYQQVRTM